MIIGMVYSMSVMVTLCSYTHVYILPQSVCCSGSELTDQLHFHIKNDA